VGLDLQENTHNFTLPLTKPILILRHDGYGGLVILSQLEGDVSSIPEAGVGISARF
jgi:hypothetical protein